MLNRMLMEKERTMLSGVGLGHEFWEEEVHISCYLVNKSPSSSFTDKTPHQVYTGKKPFHTNLKEFGCDPYLQVPKENITKLDRKYERCIFIGYQDGLKGYKIWNPETMKVVYNRDAVFKEVNDAIIMEVLQREK